MFDTVQLQSRVRELKDSALKTAEPSERDRLLEQARTYLLLAKNAAWISSTEEFLKAVKANRRWPHPRRGDLAS
jgi:hypothetical protein